MAPLVYLRNVVTLRLDAEACTGCGLCLSVCPRGVLSRANGKVEVIDRDACIECGACRQNCAFGALKVRSGVGCASAIINGMLGRKSACCVDDGCESGGSSCC